MKKLYWLILVTFIVISCGPNGNGGEIRFAGETRAVSENALKTGYQTVEIEGCEYIFYSEQQGYSGFGFMAHKGNCKNPIHQHSNKFGELTEIEKVQKSIEQQVSTYVKEKQAAEEMMRAEARFLLAKKKLDSLKFVNNIKE